MPPPTWTVGEVLAAADVNSWFVPLVADKGSDQSVTSSTLQVGDLALFLSLAASCTYEVRGIIDYEGGTQGSSDIQWGFSIPSGSVGAYNVVCVGTTGTTIYARFGWTSTGTAGTNGGGNRRMLNINGYITTSTTAANLSFTWAQNTSNGTATVVHSGSKLIARRTT